MKSITFVIHNENGLDARLAGKLVKECIACDGKVTIRSGGKTGNGKTIFNVISLRARKGDAVELEFDGGQEEKDAFRLTRFAELNL
jgi:phosphotransferase system HPr (HPr) family protein